MNISTRRVARAAGVLIVVLVVAIQFVRPARINPVTNPRRSLAAMVPITPEAASILERSCRDCHSNDTRWPWYSNLAPVSWFVIDHVNHGRSHFNYSDWAQYRSDQTQQLLKNTCGFARKGTMPMPSYLRMHADARLSDADVTALCDWTNTVLRASR